MTIELATAYISLVPSTKGVRKAIAEEFGQGAEDAADEAGKAGIGAGEQFGSNFASKAKLAMAGAGLAIGGLLVKGTLDALDRQSATADLAAKLGLSPEEAARVGEVAGDVWANNFGENIGQVNEAITAISTNLGDLGDFTDVDLQSTAEDALTLSTVLGEDVNRAVRGVGQLLTNGLAPDAETAFDLITAGAQKLPKEMRGELIDTIEEYGSSFSELGLTGEQAIAAITNSFQAGARNVDLAADAFKEFSIRAIDGSDLTIEAYEKLGFSADEMMQTIAGGGPEAAQATSDIINALGDVGDEVLQEQLGVALFGTQFEDLGVAAVLALDPMAAGMGDFQTATEDAAAALAGTFAARLESLKRKGLDALLQVGERVLPVLEGVVGFAEEFVVAWGEDGLAGVMDLVREKIEPVFTFIEDNAPLFAFVGGVIAAVLVPAFIAWAISAGAAAIATIAAAAPVIAIALAVGALAAAVVYAYQNWDFFRTAVDAVAGFLKDTLWPILKSVAGFIVDDLIPAVVDIAGWLGGVLVDAVLLVAKYFEDLWNAGIELKDQLVAAFNAIVDFVGDLPGMLADAGRGIWDFLTQPFEDAMNSIRSLWNDTVGGFSVTLPTWLPIGGGEGFTIPRLHTGGIVPGRTGAEVLILAQAGEQVVSIADVRAMRGVDPAATGGSGRGDINIDTINTGGRPLLEQVIELQHLMPA